MQTCRLIVDAAMPGTWNMAVDEAVLTEAIAGHVGPTFRWYRWTEPTLSLGYFQSYCDVPEELASTSIVRRLTGGGAILHDQELTYSVVFPPGQWPNKDFLTMVRDVHSAVAKLQSGLGVPEKPDDKGPEPFLCFERRSPFDLVLGGYKVVGSAQRQRDGAILQHGAILQSRSLLTPHLPGIGDEGTAVEDPRIIETTMRELATTWGWQFEPGELTADEIELARSLERDKYQSEGWNKRK